MTLRNGQPVVVDGTVGDQKHGSERGRVGRVLDVENAGNTCGDGVHKTLVKLAPTRDGRPGEIVAVPTRALKERRQ